jgi:hypothetical protein
MRTPWAGAESAKLTSAAKNIAATTHAGTCILLIFVFPEIDFLYAKGLRPLYPDFLTLFLGSLRGETP